MLDFNDTIFKLEINRYVLGEIDVLGMSVFRKK